MAQSTVLLSTPDTELGGDLVHADPETVRHDRHLGARAAERVDERTCARVERHLVDHGAELSLVLREQVPLVEEALPAPDLASPVRVADGAPLRRSEPPEHVHPGVGLGDRPVEVEEDGRACEIEVGWSGHRRMVGAHRLPAWRRSRWRSSRTRTGTASGTHPSRRSACSSSRMLDQLLDLLERDETYERFLLDGQTVVIDDYLEVRPEAEERLAKLAAAGRLQLGPWMVLMDEFMVSGETILRDLQLGMRRAAEIGAHMDVGYLPDMFGHVAQMPQLFRLAGFEHSVVWRGVPSAIDRTAFWWVAPDGSRVRAEYLYGSYSNGRDLPRDPVGLVDRARGYEAELGPARLAGGGMLLMNGSDHLLPQPWLGAVVAGANAMQDEYRFTITSLPEHLADQPAPADLPEWQGELRSGRARTC